MGVLSTTVVPRHLGMLWNSTAVEITKGLTPLGANFVAKKYPGKAFDDSCGNKKYPGKAFGY